MLILVHPLNLTCFNFIRLIFQMKLLHQTKVVTPKIQRRKTLIFVKEAELVNRVSLKGMFMYAKAQRREIISQANTGQ